MSAGFSMRNVENGFRLLVPLALLAFLFLLSIVSLPFPVVHAIKPAWILMVIYYWSIFRPTLMPPSLCFFTGLLLDLVSGLPLGVYAIIFTLVQWIVRDQRRFLMGQAYFTIWCVFSLVAGLSLIVQWALYGFVQSQWMSLTPVMINVLATIFLFPLVTILMLAVHKVLPEASKVYN